ncbi:hypothetical protein COU14_02630, partial [Candidatus Kaiserbacteria bacterium CG10_big_fil_rev_8_21_14_0_10_44_10]
SKFTQISRKEKIMNKFVAILVSVTLLVGAVAPASADHLHRRHQDREAQAMVGAGLAILGLAIIAGSQQSAPPRHYRQQRWQRPAPQYFAPHRSRCPDLGNYQGRLGYDARSGCYYAD